MNSAVNIIAGTILLRFLILHIKVPFPLVSNNMFLVSFWDLTGNILNVCVSIRCLFMAFKNFNSVFFQSLPIAQLQSCEHILGICYSSNPFWYKTCIIFLLLCNKLPKIHYFTDVWVRSPGPAWQVLCLGFTRLKLRYWMGWDLIWGLGSSSKLY